VDEVLQGVLDEARQLLGDTVELRRRLHQRPELGLMLPATLPSPIMGSEDWSYVLEQVPGAMAFLGTRPPGEGPVAPNHSNRMVLDEQAMAIGTAVHAAVALRWLARGSR